MFMFWICISTATRWKWTYSVGGMIVSSGPSTATSLFSLSAQVETEGLDQMSSECPPMRRRLP